MSGRPDLLLSGAAVLHVETAVDSLPCPASDCCRPAGMVEGPQVPPPPLKYFDCGGCSQWWYTCGFFSSGLNSPGNQFKQAKSFNYFMALARFRLARSNLNFANQTAKEWPTTHWKEWEKWHLNMEISAAIALETAGYLETNRRMPALIAAIRCASRAHRCRGAGHG